MISRSFRKLYIPICGWQRRRLQGPRITTMPASTLTILTRLLVVTFDSVYATPIASPGDLLASSWSWAICSRCRGAVTAIGGECGKHESNYRRTENPMDFQGRGFNCLLMDVQADVSLYFPLFPGCCWIV